MKIKEPNIKCHLCDKAIYRKPADIAKWHHIFCSRECFRKHFSAKPRLCFICRKEFRPDKSTSRYCSKGCANSARKGRKYLRNSPSLNNSAARLKLLRETFNLQSCMVEGCKYCKTYDIHRIIPGRDGGKYEIGNMFAICPNHHAEVTRGLIIFKKISDCLLVAIEIQKRTEVV